MGRIVELLVGLNALGGIAAFLGFRYAGRKVRDRILGKPDIKGESVESQLTWKCHVCGEVRPDERISVLSTERVSENGVHYTENVRYCNDRPACVEGATSVSFTKDLPATSTGGMR